MYYEKAEYERLIEQSPVFVLDKYRERSRYRREVLKLVEYLYSYLMVIGKTKYEPYGVEIVEVAKRCISNFDPDSGVFIHYFNASWKMEYGHLIGKELIREDFHGIRFTEKQSRNYRKYMKLAQSMGKDIHSEEFNQRVAEAMGLTIDELYDLKQMSDFKPVNGTIMTTEGEEFSLIDQLESSVYVDTEMIDTEKAIEFLEVIQIVFEDLQDRQKPMMSKMITSRIALLVMEDPLLLNTLQKMPFFDKDMYVECISRGTAVEAKEISRELGVAEASTSRSWRIFKDKLRSADLQRR